MTPPGPGMLALSPQYRADASQFTTTMPPDPEDVIYQEQFCFVEVLVVVGGSWWLVVVGGRGNCQGIGFSFFWIIF